MRPIVAWKISIHRAAFFEDRKRDVGWKLVYRQCIPDCLTMSQNWSKSTGF